MSSRTNLAGEAMSRRSFQARALKPLVRLLMNVFFLMLSACAPVLLTTPAKLTQGMLDTYCEHPLQKRCELGKIQEEAGGDRAPSSRT